MKFKKKLVLNKITVANLDSKEMKGINAGDMDQSGVYSLCYTMCQSCPSQCVTNCILDCPPTITIVCCPTMNC
jgi:hypothetical protein